MTDPIRLARPDVGDAELAALAEVVGTGQLTMGPKVEEFEAAIANAVGTAHAAAVSSGTAALHLALLALEIGPGDEVIVPAYTFPATANAVELCGARAVLVDVDPDTFNLDVRRGGGRRHIADAGSHGRPSLRETRRVGGAADRRAAGGRAHRGCSRSARRELPRYAVRRARRRGVPLVPSTQDRDDRGGRRGHDRRGRSRRLRADASVITAGRRSATCPCPASTIGCPTFSARSASRSSRGSRSSCRLASASPAGTPSGSSTSCSRRLRRRETVTAGRRTSSSSTAATKPSPRSVTAGIEAQIGTWALHHLAPYRAQGAFPGADRAFERALALPFATTTTEEEVERVVQVLTSM